MLSSVWDDGLGDIEVSVVCVEGGCSELTSHRREPVPKEDDDSLLFCLLVIPFYRFVDCAIVVSLPVEPRVMRRVVLHIESSD